MATRSGLSVQTKFLEHKVTCPLITPNKKLASRIILFSWRIPSAFRVPFNSLAPLFHRQSVVPRGFTAPAVKLRREKVRAVLRAQQSRARVQLCQRICPFATTLSIILPLFSSATRVLLSRQMVPRTPVDTGGIPVSTATELPSRLCRHVHPKRPAAGMPATARLLISTIRDHARVHSIARDPAKTHLEKRSCAHYSVP